MKTPPYSQNRHENDGRSWPDRRESCGSCYRSPSLQGARCQIAKRSSNLALLFAFLLIRGPRPDAHERNCRHRLPLGASQLTAVKAIVQFDLWSLPRDAMPWEMVSADLTLPAFSRPYSSLSQ